MTIYCSNIQSDRLSMTSFPSKVKNNCTKRSIFSKVTPLMRIFWEYRKWIVQKHVRNTEQAAKTHVMTAYMYMECNMSSVFITYWQGHPLLPRHHQNLTVFLAMFWEQCGFFLALGTSCLHPATLAVNETSACSGHLRLPLIKWLAWRATPVTHFRLVPCPFYLSSFGCCWMSAHSLLGGVQTA